MSTGPENTIHIGSKSTVTFDEGSSYTIKLSIPLPTPRFAEIFKQALEVDKEVKRSVISKEFKVVDDTIVAVTFTSTDLKILRVSVNSFLGLSKLVINTMEEMDGL